MFSGRYCNCCNLSKEERSFKDQERNSSSINMPNPPLANPKHNISFSALAFPLYSPIHSVFPGKFSGTLVRKKRVKSLGEGPILISSWTSFPFQDKKCRQARLNLFGLTNDSSSSLEKQFSVRAIIFICSSGTSLLWCK